MNPFFSQNGIFIMLGACLFFAVFDGLIKYLSTAFSLGELGFVRFGFGLLVTFPALLGRKFSPRGRDLFLLIFRGLLGIGIFFSAVQGFRISSISVTMVLFYTSPVWALFMGFYFLGERFTLRKVLCVVVSVLGIVILTSPWDQGIQAGNLYGLLAGLMAGGASVVIRHLRLRYNPMIIYGFQCLVGALFSFPLLLSKIHVPDGMEGFLLLVAAAFGLMAHVIMNYGFKFVHAAEGATLMMAEAVFAALVGILIFREPFNIEFVAGAVMVIGSGVCLGVYTKKAVSL